MSEAPVHRLRIDGALHDVRADGDVPLIHVLRGDCGVSGVRMGCGANQCGACHVLIDGASVPSCDTPLWAAAGKEIVTSAAPDDMHGLGVLRRAFIDLQAGQCGYCLPGILMSASALLAHDANPTDAAVRATLDRHLCRCGAHNRIVHAVLLAAERMRADRAQGVDVALGSSEPARGSAQ